MLENLALFLTHPPFGLENKVSPPPRGWVLIVNKEIAAGSHPASVKGR